MILLLPLLSGSLKQLLENIVAREDDVIAKELIEVSTKYEFLERMNGGIPDDFLQEILDLTINNRITDEVRMITARIGSDFEVSFLPKGKEPEYSSHGIWAKKNRQTGKPARIFQRLLKKEFKTYDWEKFSNRFRAELCNCGNFEIVTGSDITYWYNGDNYYKFDGTLGNSCMRYEHAQDYFKLYEENAKMLITKKDNKLTGRAILWEIDGVTIMDRVYTCFDYLEECFYNYAKDKGWWIRENNSLLHTGEEQMWRSPDNNYDSPVHRTFKFVAKNSYSYFPYVDSFRYFDGDRTFSSYPNLGNALDSTDGDYSNFENWECACCGRTFVGYEDDTPDELHYSEAYDEYYCDDCAWYCSALGDWYPNSEDQIIVHEDGGTEYYPRCYINDCLVSNPDGSERFGDLVEIDGAYWNVRRSTDIITFDPNTHKYVFISESESASTETNNRAVSSITSSNDNITACNSQR